MSRNVEVIIPVSILAFVVTLLSGHSLIDPDLGWNLAGGLWILDNLKIPSLDPFAALSGEWIDYCYLPQILFALTYRLTGFQGLAGLQIIIPVLMFICAGLFIFQNADTENLKLSKRLRPVILSAALVLFIAPIFHLRPQLFSTFLFLLFLRWRTSSKNNLVLATILVIWDNTHVYWIFAPAILIVDYLLAKATNPKVPVSILPVATSLLTPLISPYGFKNYYPIVEYSLFHSHVKEMIQEFQPLLFTKGYLLPVTCILFGYILYFSKHRAIRLGDTLLSVLFFGLSLWQMKFTPIFGVFGVMTLAQIKTGQSINLEPFTKWLIYKTWAIFCIAASLFISPTVGEVQKELLAVGKFVSDVKGPVFTQFNSGGWIELGIYLANKNSLSKPWIDGRTLVIGEKRLKDYFSLSLKQTSFLDLLAENKIEYLILNKNSPLTTLVYPSNSRLEFETENYLVLRRSLISVNNS